MDHLFISYATEDEAFAEWLTLKLTSEGYRVWCAKFSLLGGESYPIDIDEAIKEQTYRVLAIMSKSSLRKPDPVKERTLALKIGRERDIDFLITLNLDGLSSTEFDWQTTDITYVPFHPSWAKGLDQLLKALKKINAPKPLGNGKDIVSAYCMQNDSLIERTETIWSNILKIDRIPERLQQFGLKTEISPNAAKSLSEIWPCYLIGNKKLLAFMAPPPSISESYSIHFDQDIEYKKEREIHGISVSNIITNLLSKSIGMKCRERGLLTSKYDDSLFYFPKGLLPDDVIRFKNFKERRSWLKTSGKKQVRQIDSANIEYPWYLAFQFKIRRSIDIGYYAQLVVRAYVTDSDGQPFSRRSQKSRIKRVLKNWWNDKLLNRQFAIVNFLAADTSTIEIGKNDELISIPAAFLSMKSKLSIKEEDDESTRENEPEVEQVDSEDDIDEEIGEDIEGDVSDG